LFFEPQLESSVDMVFLSLALAAYTPKGTVGPDSIVLSSPAIVGGFQENNLRSIEYRLKSS
jgi:hypothetical protein